MNLPEPVTLTVHGVSAPDLTDTTQLQLRRTRRGRIKMLLVLLVCATPVIASYLTYFVIRPEGRNNYGELVQPTRSLPALQLKALDGTAVPAASLRGQWLLVVVGPARCAEACEKRLFLQRQLREMLGRERERVDKVWLLTDGAPLEPALAAAVLAPPGTTVLRADGGELARWLVPAAGQQLEDHLYVVDPMGEWMMRLPAGAEPSKAKRDLDRLLRAAASWDQAGR